MTYCVAIDLDEGLVFCSDSRTNAGNDQVATYSKMHVFGRDGDRQFVLLSAGNLATTQAVIAHIDTASFNRLGKGAAWERLQQASYYNAGWCDAYGYMLVATGRVELAIDPIINPYDIAPFAVILREAGGYLGDWAGHETIHNGECLATSKTLLPTVLQLIRG